MSILGRPKGIFIKSSSRSDGAFGELNRSEFVEYDGEVSPGFHDSAVSAGESGREYGDREEPKPEEETDGERSCAVGGVRGNEDIGLGFSVAGTWSTAASVFNGVAETPALSVWVFSCFLKSCGRLKPLRQVSQRYGLEATWTRKWDVMWSLLAKVGTVHLSQRQVKQRLCCALRPTWASRRCSYRSSASSKFFRQLSHWQIYSSEKMKDCGEGMLLSRDGGVDMSLWYYNGRGSKVRNAKRAVLRGMRAIERGMGWAKLGRMRRRECSTSAVQQERV